MSGWCGIHIFGIREAQREWLRWALNDIGHPVGGWGWGYNSDGRPWSLTVLGDGAVVAQAIRDLWVNEVPGYAITVRVSYG